MIRTLLSCLLGLMLAVTGQSMAVARGAHVAVDQVVICAGAGTSVIYLDAEGNPTSAPHLCPDCTLKMAPRTAVVTPRFLGAVSMARLERIAPAWVGPITFLQTPPGRAPPALI